MSKTYRRNSEAYVYPPKGRQRVESVERCMKNWATKPNLRRQAGPLGKIMIEALEKGYVAR